MPDTTTSQKKRRTVDVDIQKSGIKCRQREVTGFKGRGVSQGSCLPPTRRCLIYAENDESMKVSKDKEILW